MYHSAMCVLFIFGSVTASLPVVAAGSERAGREPLAGKARSKSSANSASLPVCQSPTGSSKTSGPSKFRGAVNFLTCVL